MAIWLFVSFSCRTDFHETVPKSSNQRFKLQPWIRGGRKLIVSTLTVTVSPPPPPPTPNPRTIYGELTEQRRTTVVSQLLMTTATNVLLTTFSWSAGFLGLATSREIERARDLAHADRPMASSAPGVSGSRWEHYLLLSFGNWHTNYVNSSVCPRWQDLFSITDDISLRARSQLISALFWI